MLNGVQVIWRLAWYHTLREYYYLNFSKYEFRVENRESSIRGQNKSRKLMFMKDN